MKRQVITIQEDMVIYAPHHGEVWMTVWEIAELLNVTGTAVKNTIKRIWKQSMLKDFQHSQYIKLENGYSAHVYDMEVIIAIALQMDTYQACLLYTSDEVVPVHNLLIMLTDTHTHLVQFAVHFQGLHRIK